MEKKSRFTIWKHLMEKLYSLNRVQRISAILAVLIAIVGIGAGGYAIFRYDHEQSQVLAVTLPDNEKWQLLDEKDTGDQIAKQIEETEKEEEPEVEAKELTIVGTSLEKDLKIKIQDQEEKLVSGETFSVEVTAEKNSAWLKDYSDEDQDGIIYIKNIDAGTYKVVLKPLEGYTIKTGEITVTVKDKLEYKKVDVKAEIKNEKEVNAAVEDTAVNNVPVESVPKNTVPLLESKVTTTKISKEQVDTSNFTKAYESQQRTKKTFTMQAENPVEATVDLPAEVVLYAYPGASSYTITPKWSGDKSIIAEDIVWSCTNPYFKITQSEDKSSITITVLDLQKTGAEGSVAAPVTYRQDEAGNTAQEEISFTVKVSNMTDSQTPLMDQSGNVLYLDEQAVHPATLKDYVSASVFYANPQYTGWQTRDGKVYYYDANHKAVTGKQFIGDTEYIFNSDGSLSQSSGSRGIDVSKWQGSIDWSAVAASGINFAIIRVGYRGSSTGVLVEDPYFKQNIAGARKAGIKVGVYFFTQAISEAEAVEEASMVLTLIAGYQVSYPVFIDTESASNGRANGLDRNKRTAVVQAFCRTIANGGYRPGVYASKSWYDSQLNASALGSYCIWVAQYNATCTYGGKYDMWQYSSQGTVPGIKGYVDLDICYTSY